MAAARLGEERLTERVEPLARSGVSGEHAADPDPAAAGKRHLEGDAAVFAARLPRIAGKAQLGGMDDAHPVAIERHGRDGRVEDVAGDHRGDVCGLAGVGCAGQFELAGGQPLERPGA